MLRLPWVCSRCALRSQSIFLRRQLRFQSTRAGDNSISDVLLTRARWAASECARLSSQLEKGFDTKIARRIGELSQTTNALKEWDAAHDSLDELHSLLKDSQTDSELHSLAVSDIETTNASLPEISHKLKTSLIPKHPFSDLPCLIEIKPGVGGSEAALFASELLSMYISFCSRQSPPLPVSILNQETEVTATETSLSSAVLEIPAPGSYDRLRTEAGVHRVQRVPATESKGRTHTSAVSVLVLPSFPENSNDLDQIDVNDPNSDYYINPQDVRTDIMRARGAGGQHVNTTDSAVRLTHLPTNTVVSMQDSRSQHANREKAWRLLRAKIADTRREAREEEQLQLRRSVIGVARTGRGDKVRTYNFSQGRCTDHRSGISVFGLQEVLQGGLALEKVMDSVRVWLEEQELKALAAENGP